ncbi:MAG: ACT domain-containing protein [Bacillota bacterium]|nr:ACT domain-containing protein [Bacillota bacterium]
MTVKQLSVFVQNIPGRLAEVTTFLAEHNVNLRAISMADTTEFGILRLIVDDPEHSAKLMQENDYTVAITEVLAVGFDDTPGSLAKVLTLLAEESISVDYAYAFVCDDEERACIILKPTDLTRATELIKSQEDVRLFAPEEIYNF